MKDLTSRFSAPINIGRPRAGGDRSKGTRTARPTRLSAGAGYVEHGRHQVRLHPVPPGCRSRGRHRSSRMIAAGTQSRRRLPILTLDEAKLSVSFGYVFDRKLVEPCDSIVSLLW